MRILGVLVAAVPVAFGVIRAATTGTDFRYLWVALASSLSAWVILALTTRADRQAPGVVARIALAVLVAAGASALTAVALGAGSATAVLVVAFGFAVCSGVGLAAAAPRRAG